MNDPFVGDLSRGKIEYRAKKGTLLRIASGLYAWRTPTPEEVATALLDRWPNSALTGETLAQLLLREPFTFPIQLVNTTSYAPTAFVEVTRIKPTRHFSAKGFRIHQPLLAARLMTDERAIEVFESHYPKIKGRALLEKELAFITRLPARTRKLLNLASIGSDSPLERILVKALRKKGIKVETNWKIGQHNWDLVLPTHKIAIEVDGYEYHRTRDQLILDSWKGNEATLAGWTVLRYSGSCIKHHLPEVLNQILHGECPPGV